MLEVCLVFSEDQKQAIAKEKIKGFLYWVLKITFDFHFLGYGKCGREWVILINLWKDIKRLKKIAGFSMFAKSKSSKENLEISEKCSEQQDSKFVAGKNAENSV